MGTQNFFANMLRVLIRMVLQSNPNIRIPTCLYGEIWKHIPYHQIPTLSVTLM